MEHDISFGDIAAAATDHAVPNPQDVLLDAHFDDTAQFLASRWFIGRYYILWAPRLRKPSAPFITKVYLTPPASSQEHKIVAYHEMNVLLSKTNHAARPTTWLDWQRLAESDPTGVYPCLVPYSVSSEGFSRLKTFFVRLLADHPTHDPRACEISVAAQLAFRPMLQQIELFNRVGRYREAIKLHKTWSVFCDKLATDVGALEDEWAKLGCVLLWPCVSDKVAEDEVARGERALLVELVASRMMREDAIALPLFTMREQIKALPLQPTQVQLDAFDFRVEDFMKKLRQDKFLLNGDDPDSIATLARHCTQQTQGLDLEAVKIEAFARVHMCRMHLRKEIIRPMQQLIASYWTDSVPHRTLRADAERVLAILATAKADMAALVRPSYADALPTAAQLSFRANAAWWHPTVARARMCACSRSQSAYVSCLLAALFRKGIRS